jgi:hypothetical protein
MPSVTLALLASLSVLGSQPPLAPESRANQAVSADSLAKQMHPSEVDPDIIVTAPRSKEERRDELRAMVKTILRKPRRGRPVEVFYERPCPAVLGLPERYATDIEARIRANANELGVNSRKAGNSCQPNIIVVFVSPIAGPAESWFDKKSNYLSHLLSYQRDRVLNEKGPVRAWSHSVMRSANGPRLPESEGQDPSGREAIFNPVFSPGRLRSHISMELARSVMFIEIEAAVGKSVEQLADYVTMRAFANIDGLDGGETLVAPTILTLFQDDNAPTGLTAFDQMFLQELYSLPLDEKEHRQYHLLALNIEKAEREARLSAEGE